MSAPASGSRRKRLAWMVAAFTLGVVVTSAPFLMRPSDVHPPVPSLDVPGGVPGAEVVIPFQPFALSPDGRYMALVVRTEERQGLWLRELDSGLLRELPVNRLSQLAVLVAG